METDYLNLKNSEFKEQLLKNIKKSTLDYKNSLEILQKLQKNKKLIDIYYNLLNNTFLKESHYIKNKLKNLFDNSDKINFNIKINLKIFKENFKVFSNIIIDNFFSIFLNNFNEKKSRINIDENLYQKQNIHKFSHFSTSKSKSTNSGFFMEKKKKYYKNSCFKKTKKKSLKKNLKKLKKNNSNIFLFTKKKSENKKKHLSFISKMKKELDSIYESSIKTKDIEKRLFNMTSLNNKSPYVSIRKLRRSIQRNSVKVSQFGSNFDNSEVILRNLNNVRNSIIDNHQIERFIPNN